MAKDLEIVTQPTGRMHYFVMALPATVFKTALPIFPVLQQTPYSIGHFH